MTTPVLSVVAVGKQFKTTRGIVAALDGVSLDVAPGEIVAIVGGSGSGKTTLGRVALGLEHPNQGQVLFEGSDISRLPRKSRHRLRLRTHFIFQDPYQALHPGMRVSEAVSEPLIAARVPGPERPARVMKALEEVELDPAERFAHSYPHQLSGGERQRVAMARAIIAVPALIVADEPTSMLDVSLRAGILRLIADTRDRHGTSYLIITHELLVAGVIAHRIVVLHQGRVVEMGPTNDVLSRPLHPYTVALLHAQQTLEPPPNPEQLDVDAPSLVEVSAGHLVRSGSADRE
jgi:peptide/nickel transport system ATP-binding protein